MAEQLSNRGSGNVIVRIFRLVARVLRILRITVANILMLILFVAVIAVISQIPDDVAETAIPSEGVLLIDLGTDLVEHREPEHPLEIVFSDPATPQGIVVQDLVEALEVAAEDDRIVGLAMVNKAGLNANQAQIERIETALDRFAESGKKSVAHGTFFTQDQYRLASSADTVLLDPMGDMMFYGVSLQRLYYKELLDKLAVEVALFKAGDFKDAAEPMIRSEMSEYSRQANQELADEIWSGYRRRVGENRSKTNAEFNQYIRDLPELIAQGGVSPAQLLMDQGWVDDIAGYDKDRTALKEIFPDTDFVKLNAYIADMHRTKSRFGKEQIALVTASGPIFTGKSQDDAIGSETLAAALKKVAEDENVKAVVFQVDSPGGGVFPSEVIRRAVLEVKDAKPVVTYMAGVAASGGYWISANSSEIWASPTTITGSIGVFALVPTIEASMEKIGVSVDGVGTTQFSRDASSFTGLSDQLGKVYEAVVANIYDDFIGVVAKGREMDPVEVRKIAGGRVWTGAQALALGLVDRIGSLDEAVASAAALAGVEKYYVKRVDTNASRYESILDLLAARVLGDNGGLHSLVGSVASAQLILQLFAEPQPVFALCLHCAAEGL